MPDEIRSRLQTSPILILNEILEERVEPQRARQNHGGVKRKMSTYQLADRSQDSTMAAHPHELIHVLISKLRIKLTEGSSSQSFFLQEPGFRSRSRQKKG